MAEQRAEEALGRIGIAPILQENVQHLAMSVDRSPEVLLLAPDAHEDLVQGPGPPHATLAPAQLGGERLAEAAHPATDGLVAELDPAPCQQFFHVPKAQGKAGIEPDGVADHLRREA